MCVLTSFPVNSYFPFSYTSDQISCLDAVEWMFCCWRTCVLMYIWWCQMWMVNKNRLISCCSYDFRTGFSPFGRDVMLSCQTLPGTWTSGLSPPYHPLNQQNHQHQLRLQWLHCSRMPFPWVLSFLWISCPFPLRLTLRMRISSDHRPLSDLLLIPDFGILSAYYRPGWCDWNQRIPRNRMYWWRRIVQTWNWIQLTGAIGSNHRLPDWSEVTSCAGTGMGIPLSGSPLNSDLPALRHQ